MKRLLAACIVALTFFTACDTDYYEPVFGYDNLPEVIPARGGSYQLSFEYQYYASKADAVTLAWAYRVVVCETVVEQVDFEEAMLWNEKHYFVVNIPENLESYPKPVLIEASTCFVDSDSYREWSDWTPIASSVQQSRL